MHRLEHRRAKAAVRPQARARVQVGAGGEPEASLQGAAQVGEDIREEVGRHHHVEAFGLRDHAGRQRVHVVVGHAHVGILGRDFAHHMYRLSFEVAQVIQMVTLAVLHSESTE